MNTAKFEEMYKFLSDHKCEMSKNAPNNLKCGKCKNILVNACQIPCGCQYCFDCVNEMIANSVEHCHGNTDDCKNESLSHNQLDYRTNNEISKLVMKCPEKMCLHKCELIDMEKHLRICGKKTVKCPFSDLGCEDQKILSEMVNEHCQIANFNHSRLLIKIIDNFRNEIDGLKAREEKNKNEIDGLKAKEEENKNEIKKLIQNLKVKDEMIKLIKLEKEKLWQEFESLKKNLGNKIEEILVEMKNGNLQSIESINNETNGIKMENAKLAQQVNISKVELENKIGKIDDKIKSENERMKMERDEHKRECEILKENLEKKTKEVLVELQKEKQARIESINKETKSMKTSMMETNQKSEMRMETRINELTKIIEVIETKFPQIEWTIDKSDKRNQDAWIESSLITGMIKPYKFQLLYWANGLADFNGKGCSILLCIYPGAEDKNLPWPFKADVTMKIINKKNPNASQSITRYCQVDDISIPPFYYKCNSSDFSAPFHYSNSDLTNSGVMQENFFIVECFVNFK